MKAYLNTSKKIADFLSSVQRDDGSFPARTYYGECFSILLWSFFDLYKKNIDKSLNFFSNLKENKGIAPEFNYFALLKYYKKTKDDRIPPLLSPLKFRGTNVTNWVLLRCVCKALAGGNINHLQSDIELRATMRHQDETGFIWDASDVKSLNYHAYSTALLADYYITTGSPYAKTKFLAAVEAVEKFILPNGDSVYVGRGQEQIFGYGALIFLLEYASYLTGDPKHHCFAQRVFAFLKQFQRNDGSFPLVLRKEEEGIPSEADTLNKNYLGWYSYNNIFDYLPFLGAYLAMAAHYSTFNVSPEQSLTNDLYKDKNFIVFRNSIYTAVVSPPKGYWTNDMPFPYVCYKNTSLFPCYGGEQFIPSFYSKEMIPLPYGIIGNRYIFFRDFDFLIRNNSIIASNNTCNFSREYSFEDKKFNLKDEIKFKKDVKFFEFYPINLLFFDAVKILNNEFSVGLGKTNCRLITHVNCYIDKNENYCARGKLKAIKEKLSDVNYGKGEQLNRVVSIKFL